MHSKVSFQIVSSLAELSSNTSLSLEVVDILLPTHIWLT